MCCFFPATFLSVVTFSITKHPEDTKHRCKICKEIQKNLLPCGYLCRGLHVTPEVPTTFFFHELLLIGVKLSA